jgi:fructose-1,6-bisphosphatase I
MKLEQTFMQFLMRHQEEHGRSYNFLLLMEAVMTAAKYIQHYYHTGALKNLLGATGDTNVQGEKVMTMDAVANEIVLHYLRQSHQVIRAVSEEEREPVLMNPAGRYYVYFDPLDGSSNIRHNLPVGFLFAIAKRNLDGDEDHHLRAGREFRAAGIFLIPTGVFTLALADAGVWRSSMDETMTWVRPERLRLPEDRAGWELSFNSSNRRTFSARVQGWLDNHEPRHAFRYMGALAGDFHRLLTNGGMFLYPAIVNHPDPDKNRPQGKLRLLYEAAVVAFLAREAGGAAVDEQGSDVLDLVPTNPHQRTALYVGSREMVEDVRACLRG